ncbi:MAG: glycosyltransferase family 4 protein [Clostridia bacterium]|nr:glycosyltransferase family 4 protein [Clostridia bacterium]
MKVLLSVFECNPFRGSDSYVGWSYVLNLAKYHQVYALTRTENKEDIERFFHENSLSYAENIHFIYVDRSRLFSEYFYKINRYFGFLGSYFVWQKSAYKAAKTLCSQQDISVCHHVSIADFRCAGYLWKCGKPFIYGPVGGGQETPECLSYYTRGHESSERFRSFMNRFTTALPGYKKALRNAALVYSSNDETTACMRSRMRSENADKLRQMTELCIDDQYLNDRESLQKENCDGVVHIIVSGRLIYRKGVALLIDALSRLQTDVPFVLDVFGDGDQKDILIEQVRSYGLENRVVFHGKISFEEMQQRYKDADIYVLPSLRETTGTAVFEALANKLPVVALNQNGVKHIVEQDAGILIDIESKEQILDDFASALKKLIEDRPLRLRLGQAGYTKLKEHYTWTKRAKQISEIYRELCRKE